MISDKEMLRERVETFAFSCAEKLRKQNSCCKVISVFLQTNRFRKDLPEYKTDFLWFCLTQVVLLLFCLKAANAIFEAIYKRWFLYKKAGVMVSDFVPENQRLINIF